MASLPNLETGAPEKITNMAMDKQYKSPENDNLVVDLVSIDSKTLNFSNRNQTVDNFEIQWPNHHELLTRLPLDWGFFIDVDQLEENAILKIGIFVPDERTCRVCHVVWNHDIDPKILGGTIWYWNLTDVRKRAICMMASPTTVKPNYGSKSEVHIGSSVGVFKDYDGALHFMVDEKDFGVAVERIPRNLFYGWIRIGGNGNVKITHRLDLSLGSYARHVLAKGLPRSPHKEMQSRSPPKTSQKKPTTAAKKEKKEEKEKKEKEKTQAESSQNGQTSAKAVAHTDERAAGKSRPLYVYRMTKKPRGHCLIISNSRFHDQSRNREGADADEKALKSLFEELHFIVTIKKNLTAKEMDTQLYIFARKDHQDFDAFVCVIMTHGGDNNVLLGIDDRKTRLEDLTHVQYSDRIHVGNLIFMSSQVATRDANELTNEYAKTQVSQSYRAQDRATGNPIVKNMLQPLTSPIPSPTHRLWHPLAVLMRSRKHSYPKANYDNLPQVSP